MSVRFKVVIALVVVATALVSLWWFYGPEHLLIRVREFAAVTVDDRPVHADTYIARPTYYEADDILLVAIPGQGNFLLGLGEEKFREISSSEFVRLHWGVVVLRPVSKGKWLEPLPSRNLNECRITSMSGHAVTVKF
jgi:hypothetical protein